MHCEGTKLLNGYVMILHIFAECNVLSLCHSVFGQLKEVMNHLEDDPTRIDLLRKYSIVCGRGDSKRKFDRPNNLYEVS